MKVKCIIVFLIYFLLAPAVHANDQEDLALEEQAIYYFKKGANKQKAYNGVQFLYKYFLRSELEPLVFALWQRRKQDYPNIDWQLVKDDHVRLRIANLMAQWLKVKNIDHQTQNDIKNYVISFREIADRDLRMQAVSYSVDLTISDVIWLKRVVLNDPDQNIATMAVFSIAETNKRDAENHLKELYSETNNMWIKSKIEEAIKMIDRGYMKK